MASESDKTPLEECESDQMPLEPCENEPSQEQEVDTVEEDEKINTVADACRSIWTHNWMALALAMHLRPLINTVEDASLAKLVVDYIGTTDWEAMSEEYTSEGDDNLGMYVQPSTHVVSLLVPSTAVPFRWYIIPIMYASDELMMNFASLLDGIQDSVRTLSTPERDLAFVCNTDTVNSFEMF